ncbi:MAG: flagellar hook-basal body complex protein, partial [Aestuariivita sp.]|uniref:flagellar hook-basal body complex protein n=1 Tax=Aestuariivita sp. TaxID=1872407 RepID=UPI003BAF5CDF
MTISSSLNASVAGLATNASRLATISDNIANSSTIGYKRIQTDFQSMVISAGSGSYSAGGVRATTQRMIDDSGSLVSTSNPTDLAVRGAGFLPVTSETQVQATNGDPQMRLTSTGSFRADSDGYLKTPSGMILMAWPANPDGSMPVVPRDTADGLVPVQINENQLIGSPTTEMLLGVNLPADETAAGSAGTAQSLSIEYFDNLGASESIDISFTPTVPATGASNEWTMVLRDSAAAGAVIGEYRLNFDDSRTSGGTLGSVTTVSGGAFDVTTGSVVVNVAGGPIELNLGIPGDPGRMTQLADTFMPMVISKDGAPPG